MDGLTVSTPAPVDSGSRFNLVSNWVARALGLRLDDDQHCRKIKIARQTQLVSFHHVTLGIRPHLSSGDPRHRWAANVGFFKSQWEPPWMILGQIGFFDHFTVTMQSAIGAMAIEAETTLDQRSPNAVTPPARPSM